MSNAASIGIDIGSTSWKGCVVDSKGRVMASRIQESDPRIKEQTARLLAELMADTGASSQVPVIATGYGRKQVEATRQVTEITCHTKGCFHQTGKPGVLIDIGGQDTKVIHIGPKGSVLDFQMNDKCAAGTGRFLEVILQRLRIPLDQVGQHISSKGEGVKVSSTCTVFAESEVVSLVAQGARVEAIARGVLEALAARVSSLAGKVPEQLPLFMSGGVALNPAMVAILAEALGRPITVLDNPQLVGAHGAALSGGS